MLGGAIKVINTYCHDMEVDVQEEKDDRIIVIFEDKSTRIVIWLDTEKADKLQSYLMNTLESISRRKVVVK